MDNTAPLETPPSEIQNPQLVHSEPGHTAYYSGGNWKKWLLIYLVVGLVLYGGVYYFYFYKNSSSPYSSNTSNSTPAVAPTAMQDETENWKTYTNQVGGYIVKYPPSWLVKEWPGSQVAKSIVQIYNPTTQKQNDDGTTIPTEYVSILVSRNYESASSYVNKLAGVKGFRQESISISGVQARASKIDGVQEDWSIYLSNDKNLITINSSITDLHGTKLENSIISTFQFTDQMKINAENLKTFDSPDKSYTVTSLVQGDYNKISILSSNKAVIVDDLIQKNSNAIGYEKLGCQCGTNFKNWIDNSHFIISILNANSNEYEYTVDAKFGLVDGNSFRKIK